MSTNCKATVTRFFYKFMTILTSAAIFLLQISLPILFLPIYIYRYILAKCFKWFRKDLDKILAGGNNFMLSYDDWTGSNQNTTVIVGTVQGSLEIEEARKIVTDKLLNATTDAGALKYPELQQYPVKWMGYYFWKNDKQFHVNNHVNFHTMPEQGKVYSDEDIAKVEAELVTRPHLKNRPLWEIVIVPNVKTKLGDSDSIHSVVFFRTHHGLMDGFALYKLIAVELGTAAIEFPKFTLWNKLVWYISQIFRIPYALAHAAIKMIRHDVNDFRKEHNDLTKFHVGTEVLKIPLQYLKEIRYEHKVSLTSVITAGCIGGLRRAMLDMKMEIPERMIFGSPQPVPGHPGKLRVHASAASLLLPVGIPVPTERLKSIDRFYNYQRGSAAPAALFIITTLIFKVLPPWLINLVIPNKPPTGSFNIFAGSPEKFSYFGKQAESFHFSFGQQSYGNSVHFATLSYGGNVHFKITVNTSIFTEQSQVKRINDHILEEFKALRRQDV